MCDRRGFAAIVLLLFGATRAMADADHALRYDLGAPATPARIATEDIAIGPTGEELPAGEGRVAEGREIYAAKCAACHGASGSEGPDPVLVGGRGSLDSAEPLLTVGSYWSRATTLYDYVYRAMPFTAPGSLVPDEVYALTAYLLNANDIIDDDAVMNASTLPAVHMPNHDGFVPDPRPDIPLPPDPQSKENHP